MLHACIPVVLPAVEHHKWGYLPPPKAPQLRSSNSQKMRGGGGLAAMMGYLGDCHAIYKKWQLGGWLLVGFKTPFNIG